MNQLSISYMEARTDVADGPAPGPFMGGLFFGIIISCMSVHSTFTLFICQYWNALWRLGFTGLLPCSPTCIIRISGKIGTCWRFWYVDLPCILTIDTETYSRMQVATVWYGPNEGPQTAALIILLSTGCWRRLMWCSVSTCCIHMW